MSGFEIPAKLKQQWIDLLREEGKGDAAQDLYFSQILPPLLEHLVAVPEHQAIRARQTDTLISLMGFSPETTVIAAAIVRPKRLVVISSARAEKSYDRMMQFLLGHRGIVEGASRVTPIQVDPTDYESIYEQVKKEIDPNARNLVDVTGGKKVMSATAGALGWRLDVPLCYLESKPYDPELRRPLPGNERLILLRNPAHFKLAEMRREALAAYDLGRYAEASERLRKSRSTRDEHILEDVGIALCTAYVALADLNLIQLSEAVVRLRELTARPVVQRRLQAQGDIEAHLDALDEASRGAPVAFAATCKHLGRHYAGRGRHDFAALLAYRCMEALVAHGLDAAARRNGHDGFSMASPDWTTLGDPESLEQEYAELVAVEDRLPARVHFVQGFALLCMVSKINERPSLFMRAKDAVGRIAGLATLRNRSVLAHGDSVLTEEDSTALADAALQIAEAVLTEEEFRGMQGLAQLLRPIDLNGIATASQTADASPDEVGTR